MVNNLTSSGANRCTKNTEKEFLLFTIKNKPKRALYCMAVTLMETVSVKTFLPLCLRSTWSNKSTVPRSFWAVNVQFFSPTLMSSFCEHFLLWDAAVALHSLWDERLQSDSSLFVPRTCSQATWPQAGSAYLPRSLYFVFCLRCVSLPAFQWHSTDCRSLVSHWRSLSPGGSKH